MEVSIMTNESAAHPITPHPSTQTHDHPGVIARPPRIAYLLLAIGAILERLSPWPLFPAGSIAMSRYGLAGGLAAIGLILMTHALRAFRKAGTNVETPKPATALVTGGIYARSRNPMYVSLLLLFAAVAVLADSAWFGLLLVIYVLMLRFGVIAREERYLERKFGGAYGDYRAHVRRWL
jgi:protein-S-isoprenylcysteine O-methyltransferase Ste14